MDDKQRIKEIIGKKEKKKTQTDKRITEKKEKDSKKKKYEQIKEYTIGEVHFRINYNKSPIKRTQRAIEIFKIIEKKGIKHKPIKEALNLFFKKIPSYIIKKIEQIECYPEKKIILIRTSKKGELLYRIGYEASLSTGWYYYITGTSLETIKSINKIEKYLDDTYYEKDIDSSKKNVPKKLINNKISLKKIKIRNIIDIKNQHSFEIEIEKKEESREKKNYRIFIDVGFDWNYLEYEKNIIKRDNKKIDITTKVKEVKNYLNKNIPEWIIITHNHRDHMQGLIKYIVDNNYYNKIKAILCTKTTLFLLIKKINQKYWKKIIKKTYIVKYKQSINIADNFKVVFYPSGHMPGSLSCAFKFKMENNKQWVFFYSSDFIYPNISPLRGLESATKYLPKNIDIAVLDGTNASKENRPLQKQLNDIYIQSKKTWDDGGSVVIPTEENSIAFFIYNFFYRKDKENSNAVPIYVDKKILENFSIISHCNQDLDDDYKSQIRNNKNPFESWRLRPIHTIQDIFESLSEPSLIITHPTDIRRNPFSEIFPLVAMNHKNLIIFAHFISYDDYDTQDYILEDNIENGFKTTLNGILKKEVHLEFKPLCRVLNHELDNEKDLFFQNHPDKTQLEQFEKGISIKRKIFFHDNKTKFLELIFPYE